MSQIRKIATAGGTFAVALGIGFVMQNGDALASRLGGTNSAAPTATPTVPLESARPADPVSVTAPASVSPAPVLASAPIVAPAGGLPLPTAAAVAIGSPPLAAAVASLTYLPQAMTRRPAPDAPMVVALPADVPAPSLAEEAPRIIPAALETDSLMADSAALADAMNADAMPDCTPQLTGTVLPGAMVGLSLVAACAPSQIVTFHHQGMMFSVLTTPEGTADVVAPALTEGAVFMVDINGVDGAVAVATVPDVGLYDRAILQYQADAGLQLHALEFGADYSDAGHLWNASMGSADAMSDGTGGQVVRLGDTGSASDSIVEVYSFPTAQSAQAGQIMLSVEAEVTQSNCGREVSAQSIQIHPDAAPTALDLTLTMPGCDALGEFLILDSMLADLTLVAH